MSKAAVRTLIEDGQVVYSNRKLLKFLLDFFVRHHLSCPVTLWRQMLHCQLSQKPIRVEARESREGRKKHAKNLSITRGNDTSYPQTLFLGLKSSLLDYSASYSQTRSSVPVASKLMNSLMEK